MDAAPTVFACFDQPDLKAPYTLHVRAPEDWTVIAQRAGHQPGARASWEFERSQPLSTYFVTLVAGPYHLISDEHDGIPLGLSVPAPAWRSDLDADADELFTLTKQCFDEFHRLFGIRYPFGNYHQAFVPEFNAGAMENPGCVTFRDPLVFTSRVTRGMRIQRATTIAHEMAHQWFGNIVTPAWWDDLWLNESFAEYMGNRVTADVTEYDDAWVDNAYARRQWGLNADQRPSTHPVAGNGAVDASAALQDFDGISYAKGSSILKQLNATLGDEVFFAGAIDHFTRHRFGNATMHDLFESLGARRRRRPVGVHRPTGCAPPARTAIVLDRAAGVIRRTPPAEHPADRSHTFRVAVATDGVWSTRVGDARRPGDAVRRWTGDAVVLDPYEDTWAVRRSPTPRRVDAAARRCCPTSRTRRCAPASGTTCAAPSTTPPSPPPTSSTWWSRALPVESTEDSRAATRAVAARRRAAARARRLAGARPRAPRSASSASPDVGLGAPAVGVPDGDLDGDRRRRAARLAGRDPRRHRPRPRPALADAGAARRPRRHRPRRAARRARRRADRRVPGRAHARRGVAARPPRPRRWRGTSSPAARRAQLRARGRRPRHVARRPGGADRRRTSTATSTSCPAPSGCAAAGCWPTRPSSSSR